MQDDIVGVIDASGNIVASYSYDTWGALLSSSGSMANINPMRYKGYYYDTDTGMYYLQSRYYDPGLKRFINADDAELIADLTLESVLGGNIFAYCENNAVNASDPTGYVTPANVIGAILGGVSAGASAHMSTNRSSNNKTPVIGKMNDLNQLKLKKMSLKSPIFCQIWEVQKLIGSKTLEFLDHIWMEEQSEMYLHIQ